MDAYASVGVAVGAPDDTWKLIVFASTKKVLASIKWQMD